MDRKEAIEKLKNIRNVPSMFIDEAIKDLVETLEKPPTLAEFLGWEEGVEYEYEVNDGGATERARILNNNFQVYSNMRGYIEIDSIFLQDIEKMRQATKVEKKLKAYHVKDEYSYNELMKELEEQGYMWGGESSPTKWNIKDSLFFFGWEFYITTDHEKRLFYGRDKVSSSYDLIEYHKEEPKFYAEIKVPAGIKTHSWLKKLNYDNTVFDMVSWFQLDKCDAKTKTEWSKRGINDTNANFEEVV